MDMVQAAIEAQDRLRRATNVSMPRGTLPNWGPPEPPGIGEMWERMTPRQLLALSRDLGAERTARFVRYMIGR